MQHKNTKRKIVITKLVACFSVLALSCLFAYMTMITKNTEAVDGAVGVNVGTALAMSLDTNSLEFGATPISGEVSATDDVSVTVSTNNITGYELLMSTNSESIDLTHSNGTDEILSTSNTTAGALAVNTWGYNLSGSSTNFLKIPALSSAIGIADSDAPVASETTTVTLGAKVDISMPSGDYTNVLVFTAVANPTPAPDFVNWVGGDIYIEGENFDASSTVSVGGSACQSTKLISSTMIRCTLPSLTDHRSYAVLVKDGSNNTIANQEVLYDGSNKGNMQEFRAEQCGDLERGQAQAWTDSRNNQSYRIKKMADGNCWMIDNLRYAYGTYVSGSTASIDTSAQYADPGTASSSSYCSAGATLSTCYGYLYNWYGATYGTGTTSITSGDVAGNICPNTTNPGSTSATSGGWRLPKGTNTTSSDIGILNAAMAGDDGTTTTWTASNSSSSSSDYYSGFQPTGSFQGVFSGYYYSGLDFQGSFGLYWSSAAYSSTDARFLYFRSSYVYPASNHPKNFGFAVRCLVGS